MWMVLHTPLEGFQATVVDAPLTPYSGKIIDTVITYQVVMTYWGVHILYPFLLIFIHTHF